MNINLLREKRKRIGLTQETVAKEMGYSNKSGYCMLETGQINVSIEQAMRLKSILSLDDTEFSQIFFDEEVQEACTSE